VISRLIHFTFGIFLLPWLLFSLLVPSCCYAQLQGDIQTDSVDPLAAKALILTDSLRTILESPSIPYPPAWELPSIDATPKIENAVSPGIPKRLLLDQKALWTSPLHISANDAVWLIPFVAATGTLIATDRSSSGGLSNTEDQIEISHAASQFGAAYTSIGTAGSFYLAGKLFHNQKARETGILGMEALIDSSIVGFAMKVAFGRERPYDGTGEGRFWKGGSSFPSGHSLSAWSLAVVVADEYSDHKLIGVGAYGLATMVGVSRFTARNHFPSDVLVGSVLGGLIGRYVYHAHHDLRSEQFKSGVVHHLIPTAITPFETKRANYAVSLKWNL
jgi:membrane-associated phospholipid phosphatase